MTRLRILITASALALTALLPHGGAKAASIYDTLAADSRFSILTRAINAAGYQMLLSEQGPFTIFAPTDQAFSRVPAGTLENLLQPENQPRLRTLLRQHIAFERVPGSALNVDGQVPTGNLERIRVRGLQLPIMFGGAPVVARDIRADNGVIHGIDGVLLP